MNIRENSIINEPFQQFPERRLPTGLRLYAISEEHED